MLLIVCGCSEAESCGAWTCFRDGGLVHLPVKTYDPCITMFDLDSGARKSRLACCHSL